VGVAQGIKKEQESDVEEEQRGVAALKESQAGLVIAVA